MVLARHLGARRRLVIPSASEDLAQDVLIAQATLVTEFATTSSASSRAESGLRRCCYLLNCLLQFLHVDRFGQMRGKTSATAALHVFLHPITADRYALGVADLRQLRIT